MLSTPERKDEMRKGAAFGVNNKIIPCADLLYFGLQEMALQYLVSPYGIPSTTAYFPAEKHFVHDFVFLLDFLIDVFEL